MELRDKIDKVHNVQQLFYEQERLLLNDFQLDYDVIHKLADWPNSYIGTSQTKMNEYLREAREDWYQKTVINSILTSSGTPLEKRDTSKSNFKHDGLSELQEQI